MHITLLTYGSHDDFQPFLVLAIALQKAGHRVRLAAEAGVKRNLRTGGGSGHPPGTGAKPQQPAAFGNPEHGESAVFEKRASEYLGTCFWGIKMV